MRDLRDGLVALAAEATTDQQCDWISELLDKCDAIIRGGTRSEAAERAVVEAAMRFERHGGLPKSGADWDTLGYLEEACARLRALREQAKAEECGARDDGGMEETGSLLVQTKRGVETVEVPKCDLPRGHEGKHCGDLGRWTWGDS